MFFTARAAAAFAAVCAFFAAVFTAAAAADKSNLRHIHIGSLFRFTALLFHRAGILVFAAGAARRAFTVFTTIRAATARIFVIVSRSRRFLRHRAMRRRILGFIACAGVRKGDRNESENQQCGQRD